MTNHSKRATTYTVLNRHGEVLGAGETLASAANVVMGYDGHEFEIRPADGGFDLWTSSFSRNSTAYNGLTKSVVFSRHTDEELATAEIYRSVIRKADWWCGCRVMTDADYAAECAELDAEDQA